MTGMPIPPARTIHMVGIGGAGMSGLARLALQAGYRVTGTDRAHTGVLSDLEALGARVRVGHSASAIGPDVDALVVSSAIAADNPERLEAARRRLQVMHRSELLVELMRGHRGLAVAGAHGKSTTSAMLVSALGDASACVGATITGGGGTGAVWGSGDWFVAEADESDRSLLRLEPEGAILLNVDHDHHTTYASIDDVEAVFAEFLGRVPVDGMIVAGPEPDAAPRAWRLAAGSGRPYRLIGEAPGAWAQIGARDADGAWLEVADGRSVCLRLQVPGAHNVANAACAIALAEWCGVPLEVAAERLADFTGVGRRFEYRGAAADIIVVDDYAHHPAEIRATLRGARERHAGRIVAIFQPHLFSRTRALADDLADALGTADIAIVTEIYAAREAPDPSISGRRVADAVSAPTHAEFASTLDDALVAALRLVRPGDLVLTLGAGDITELGEELLRRLEYEYQVQSRGGGASDSD